LSSIRKTIRELNNRASDDEVAFQRYIANHPVAIFSHKGYPRWQDAEARDLLLQDIEAGLHKVMKKSDLYASRPEYYEQFPLNVFREKIAQEIGTAKEVPAYTAGERQTTQKQLDTTYREQI
jgi:hypothetical protein